MISSAKGDADSASLAALVVTGPVVYAAPEAAQRLDGWLADLPPEQAAAISALAAQFPKVRTLIEGIAEAELKKHVNHQVELTGQVVQPAAGVTDDAPDFRATSVKMLAATCAAK